MLKQLAVTFEILQKGHSFLIYQWRITFLSGQKLATSRD